MHIDDDVAHALSEVLKNNTSIINVDLQCLRMIHNDDVDYNANDDDDDDDDDQHNDDDADDDDDE